MAKQYDTTMKSLIDAHPGDWAAYLAAWRGLGTGPVSPLDTDLSETLQADRLLRIDAAGGAYALHVELEARHELGRPMRLLRYNVAAAGRSGLPVRSVLVLLRPSANSSDLTGVPEWGDVTFRYGVLRVWEQSVEELLAAGPGLAPLAVLSDAAAGVLDETVPRVVRQLANAGLSPATQSEMLKWLVIVAGMRYDEAVLADLYRRASMAIHLEDSAGHHFLLRQDEAREARGRLSALREVLAQLGGQRFGTPTPEVQTAIDAVTDPDHLARMTGAILDAVSWDDLLARSR